MTSIRFLLLTVCFGLLTTIVMATKQNISIDADQFEYDQKQSIVTAFGNVLVKHQGVKLKGSSVHFNEKTQVLVMKDGVEIVTKNAYLTSSEAKILGLEKKILLDSKVEFEIQDVVGYSNTASVDIVKKIIRLQGNPVAKKGNNKINASLIEIDLEHNKVKSFGRSNIIFNPKEIR